MLPLDKMRRKPAKSILFILVFLVAVIALGSLNTYAVEVVGAKTGLRVNVSDVLVPTDNLAPGDTKASTMTISFEPGSGINASSLPVWLKAEITDSTYGEGGGDLDDKLELTVTREDGLELYQGSISGLSNAVEVGNVQRNGSVDLTFTIHLPGEETGNAYQAAFLKVKWIVITSYTAPPTPKPRPPRYKQPDEPTITVITVEPTEPPAEPTEVPEDIEIEDETIPGGIPQEPEKEDEPDEPEPEIVIIEDEIVPTGLPKTGELPPILFYGLGAGIIYAGVRLSKKKEKKEK